MYEFKPYSFQWNGVPVVDYKIYINETGQLVEEIWTVNNEYYVAKTKIEKLKPDEIERARLWGIDI